jgi:hypothetical protein
MGSRPTTIIIDTTGSSVNTITTIYQLDALVELAKPETVVIVNEPSLEVLNQLNTKRQQYQLVYRVS